ncbi:MAG TPA: 4-(cytidine 5'-diphospho)-2-C-methyl-D-erythritol kinase [Blastocatellia bacterium]|nr:4-(cytidine 5'-diphospho)-2-C-methyl-D-erythritol kinase [Blastocatellia bacterium]
MLSSIEVRSYAKINWTLDVLHKREDGYHELRTIYQTVSLHDTISVTETAGPIDIICDDSRVPCDDTNLAFRAVGALREALGIVNGARIEINKRIPVAAGLGGGSSNAAATLLAVGKLWQIDIGYGELVKIAASLGSDVPFFLIGGTALGIGRGEEVYPIEQVNSEHLLLVNPGFAVSTPEAYARLSRLTRPKAALNIHFTLLAAKGISDLPLVATNDLEEVVIATHQEIAEVKRRLVSLGARHALMSGSGATVFGVFDNLQTTERAASMLHAAGYWAQRARTVDAREYQATIFQ